MPSAPERPRREYQLPTWPITLEEYKPAFTRDPELREQRKANVGTHATVLAMQSEGLRIGLGVLGELRDSPRSLEEWSLLQGGAMIGSAYHMFQWEGTPLTHRKLRLPELASDDGVFADPAEFHAQTRLKLIELAEATDKVAESERERGRISKEAYVRLAHQMGNVATRVAVLPTRYYGENDDPVAVQQEAFETVDSAWRVAIGAYHTGRVDRLPSIAQLADADSPLRRFIRDPRNGLSDEVSEAVESI